MYHAPGRCIVAHNRGVQNQFLSKRSEASTKVRVAPTSTRSVSRRLPCPRRPRWWSDHAYVDSCWCWRLMLRRTALQRTSRFIRLPVGML